jgi:hypothetical protein
MAIAPVNRPVVVCRTRPVSSTRIDSMDAKFGSYGLEGCGDR